MNQKLKFFYFLLLFFQIFLALDCRREPAEKEKSSLVLMEAEREAGRISPSSNAGGDKKDQIRRREGWPETEGIALSEAEMEVVKITTTKVSLGKIRSELQAMGKVLAHPQRKAIVSYAFPARIVQVQVQIGDWVRAGQKLLTLQSEEVGNAKSEFYKARADYELAKVNDEREKRLYDRGVGARKDLLATEAVLKIAEADLNAAEKKLHILGFTEEEVEAIASTHQINPFIDLFAPLSGKVIVNRAILGAMVDQTTEILAILDPLLVCVDAEIYERDIAKVRIGQEVEVAVPAYREEKFFGKISYISDVLQEETRTIAIRTEVENKDFKLKPGMFADVKIFLNNQTRALLLPDEAVLDDGERKIVFILKDGKYFPRIVHIGAREKGVVEIIDGVEEGETVVTNGNYQLKSKFYEGILHKGHIH